MSAAGVLITLTLTVRASAAPQEPTTPPTSVVHIYADPLDAWKQRHRALSDLGHRLGGLGPDDRDAVLRRLDDRLDEVRTTRRQLLRRLEEPALSLPRREVLAREVDLLSLEESTLLSQQALLRATAPSSPREPAFDDTLVSLQITWQEAPGADDLPAVPTATEDRVAWGHRVVVAPGERVRHVIAIGGDVLVFGAVDGKAASLGGHVLLAPQADVAEGPIALGGSVLSLRRPAPHDEPASDPSPAIATSSALAGGLGLLGSGLAPDLATRAGRHLVRHPLRALVRGAVVSGGLVLAAIALLLPGWTAPLALALPFVALALGAMGLLGALQRLATTLLPAHPLPATLALAAATVVVAGVIAWWSPAVLGGALAVLGLAGLGAASATR